MMPGDEEGRNVINADVAGCVALCGVVLDESSRPYVLTGFYGGNWV